MRVAIYVRVSTMEQAESGYSIDEQEEKLKTYAELREWKVVDIYKDGGFTGSNIKRPELTRLINDVALGKLDTVLVYKLDRLSRSQKDTLYLIEDVFLKNNVNFVSLSENFDTDSPFGKAMIGMLAVFAQLEREQITERMKMGKVGRAKSGKTMSWSKKTFGYDLVDGELVINPLEATIVRRIFDMYVSGVSTTKIRDILNEEGHVTKDIPWSYRVVRQTLENPVHIGKVKYLDKVYDGMHEPIISQETFDRTQELIEIGAKNTDNPSPFKAKYLTTGFVKCGYCHCNLTSAFYKPRRGSTERHQVFYCLSQKKSKFTLKAPDTPCHLRRFSYDELKETIVNEVNKLRRSKKKIKPLEPITDVTQLRKRLTNISEKLDRLSSIYIEGRLSQQTYEKKYSALVNEKEFLVNEISKMNTGKDEHFNLIQDTFSSLPKDFGALDLEVQRSILVILLKKIEITNDGYTFYWNFKH